MSSCVKLSTLDPAWAEPAKSITPQFSVKSDFGKMGHRKLQNGFATPQTLPKWVEPTEILRNVPIFAKIQAVFAQIAKTFGKNQGK